MVSRMRSAIHSLTDDEGCARQANQFSTLSPRMRLNSLVLAVTPVASMTLACAAISSSLAVGVARDGDDGRAGVQRLDEAGHEIGRTWAERRATSPTRPVTLA
jgi:hypothetical protein